MALERMRNGRIIITIADQPEIVCQCLCLKDVNSPMLLVSLESIVISVGNKHRDKPYDEEKKSKVD